jgi:hypothetical protein
MSNFASAHRAALRHYELGRIRMGLRHAVFITALVGLVAGLWLGGRALAWLPVSFAMVTFAEWRGLYLAAGARRGILAGLASMALPISALRHCYAVAGADLGASCCASPTACWAAGTIVGLAAALLIPKAPAGRRLEAALGLILGFTSVAVTRCSVLFLGEAVGLLGGMAAGLVAMALARTYVARVPG